MAVFTVISNSAPWADATVEPGRRPARRRDPEGDCRGRGRPPTSAGQTAGYIDLATQIADKLPLMIAIVVGLSFIVLLIAFRSLAGADQGGGDEPALGRRRLRRRHRGLPARLGLSLIGLDHAIPIVSFVPLLMFAILFGLSMDYEVFLLTQMSEHYASTATRRRAVVEGLANTGRVITSAAAIMVCVFASFVLNGDPVVKEFGVGLAVAIAIDSTIVRCLLVPAVMVLLGKRAWWMPSWLDRIVPHISIEGEDYFAARDAKLAAAAAGAAAGAGGRA